ncbi:MAG: hypothetical protein IJV39_02835 [Ruminococcus sp.]|nr:hypothetical protein [Ruminococcus sp.]
MSSRKTKRRDKKSTCSKLTGAFYLIFYKYTDVIDEIIKLSCAQKKNIKVIYISYSGRDF